MAYWRMAFKEGIQGPNIFPECKERGIAAIGYKILSKYGDLSKYDEDKFDEICRKESAPVSIRASLKKLRYRMKKGDTIYAKDGLKIVGKGKITDKYHYDKKILKPVTWWPHFVIVDWDKDFTPFRLVLGADLHTILELKDERLREILKAETDSKLSPI